MPARDAERDQFYAELYLAGLSIGEIALGVSVSKCSVFQALERQGVRTRTSLPTSNAVVRWIENHAPSKLDYALRLREKNCARRRMRAR